MTSPDRPILVTGATGFLGSRLARMLATSGRPVRVLARRTSDRARLAGLDLEFAEGDITDRASVESAVRGVRAVFHVAALYELGTPDPSRMRRINVDGTGIVLESAAAAGVPAIHVSSTAALGPSGPGVGDERHWSKSDARSAYEATKREAHELARRMISSGARVRIAMPSTIYGPNDPSLVGRLHRLYARGFIKVGAMRAMRMSLVHVDDCADGIARVLDSGRDGEEYLVCAQVVTVGEWLATLARVTGIAAPRVYVPDAVIRAAGPLARALAPLFGASAALVNEGISMSDGVDWAFTADKARSALGWSPRALEEGLRETMAWYRDETRGAR